MTYAGFDVPPYDVKITGREPGDNSDAPVSPRAEANAPDASRPSSSPGSRRDPSLSGVKLSLNDLAAQIEIRDSNGRIQVHDLPPSGELHDSVSTLGIPELRDSALPMRRDSLGMRMLVKDSWSPEATKRRRAPASVRDFVRSVASWALLIALSTDILALFLEPYFLTRTGAPLSAAVAAAIAAVGLSLFFAMGAAVPLASVHSAVRYIGQRKGAVRRLWPVPLLLLGWLVVADLAPHKVIHSLSLGTGQLILTVLFCLSLVAGTAITRIRRGRLRVVVGLSVTALALAMNVMMSPVLTHEPRDLLWLATIFCFASIFYPIRRQIVGWPHERVSRAMGYLVAGSLVCLFAAPVLAPDWRTHASLGGRFAPRLARFARMLVDLDGDGFSAIAWGTDCDDSTAARNPAAPETADGRDRNCNGKTRPATSTDAQRGLAPPMGQPDAASGEIDRVILLTIDCFRNDALTSEYTPNLIKLAERGVRLDKLYSSGARTAMSLPFMLRGAVDAPTVAEILDREDVTTTALFGYRHTTLERNVFDGFQTLKRPDKVDRRIRAPDLTDLGLEDLRDPAHAQRHFLWMHYFDAHGPRTLRVLPADVPTYPPIIGETDPESSLYLSELSFIDAQIGRFLEGVEALGGFDKTMIIVTNDHGEGFGRHGVFEHGVSAFEAIIHAPGILVAPGIAAGTYAHVVAQRDIASSILGAFGLVAKHPEIERFGRSWLRLREAPKAPLHDFVFTYETTSPFERWADAPMASIVDDRGKLSVSYVDGITRFYRLDHDVNEDFELTSSRPSEVARYRDELELFRDIDSPPR